jgi:hypothetical protein
MLCAVTGSHHLCHAMPNFTHHARTAGRRQQTTQQANRWAPRSGSTAAAGRRAACWTASAARGRKAAAGGGRAPTGCGPFSPQMHWTPSNAHSDVATYHCREVRSREWLRRKLVRYHEQCALCHTSGVSLQGSAKGDAALEAADRARAARDPSVQQAHERLASRWGTQTAVDEAKC